jgi:DNA replication protein DnaC
VAATWRNHAAILLRGPTGVGKSFVAHALGVAAGRQHKSVLFTKTRALLTDLAGGRAGGRWATRLLCSPWLAGATPPRQRPGGQQEKTA